mgnify:FL=1|tara:strand:+ start:2673 stop:3098 length:426 start_codon:yes stop_codon:yes gene_type:complete
MATKPSLKVTLDGPLANNPKNTKKGVKAAMKKAGDSMVKDVQRQLYPNHGYLTGRLRKSVTWRESKFFKNGKSELIVDTSRGHPNQNVPYTRWIEEGGRHPRWGTMTRFRGYHMFRNTMTKFGKQKRIANIVGVGIVKANT